MIRPASADWCSDRPRRRLHLTLVGTQADPGGHRGAPAARFADGQPPTSSAIAASKTLWWRSTSTVVVTGDINAMLWNGVSMMPRFNR